MTPLPQSAPLGRCVGALSVVVYLVSGACNYSLEVGREPDPLTPSNEGGTGGTTEPGACTLEEFRCVREDEAASARETPLLSAGSGGSGGAGGTAGAGGMAGSAGMEGKAGAAGKAGSGGTGGKSGSAGAEGQAEGGAAGSPRLTKAGKLVMCNATTGTLVELTCPAGKPCNEVAGVCGCIPGTPVGCFETLSANGTSPPAVAMCASDGASVERGALCAGRCVKGTCVP